jgi:Pre-toxin TG
MLSIKNTAFGRLTSHLLVLSMILSSATSYTSCGRQKQASRVKEVLSDAEEPSFKNYDPTDNHYGNFGKERSVPVPISLEPRIGMHVPEYGDRATIAVSSPRSRGERDYVFANPSHDYNPATNEIRMPEAHQVKIAPHASSAPPTSPSPSMDDAYNHRVDDREFIVDSEDKSWDANSQFAEAVEKRKAEFTSKLSDFQRTDAAQHKDLSDISGMMGRHNAAVEDVLRGTDVPPSAPKKFKTPENSPQGHKVRMVSKAIDEAERDLNAGPDAQSPIKQNAIGLAKIQTSAADLAYSDGEVSTGDALLHGALISLDVVLSFVPGIGLAKDLASLATGVNVITGDRLTALDTGLIAAGILVPGILVGAVKATRYARAAMATETLDSLIMKALMSDALSHVPVGDLESVITEAISLGAKEIDHVVTYSRHMEGIKSLPVGMTVKRIRFGNSNKVVVIGGGMTTRVIPASEHLGAHAPHGANVEVYVQKDAIRELDAGLIREHQEWNGWIPRSEIPTSHGYLDNMGWAEETIRDNFTVFDVGPRMSDLGRPVESIYLNGEYARFFP